MYRIKKDYLGLINEWKMLKYKVYKKKHQREQQEMLAKDLLFGGHFE